MRLPRHFSHAALASVACAFSISMGALAMPIAQETPPPAAPPATPTASPDATPAATPDATPPRETANAPRRPRTGPPSPDWPRAGGFGSGREQPMLEGIVVEEMMNADGGRRELTDEDLARAVAVAKLVSVEWGNVMEARAKSEPAQMRASLRAGGRRLLGLVALQERAPEVFEAKVTELRAQAATNRAASEVRKAKESGGVDAAQMTALETALDAAAAAQVAATLEMRRAEYSALATRLATMKDGIDADAKNRATLEADMKARALAPRDGPRDGPREPGRDGPRDGSRDAPRDDPRDDPREPRRDAPADAPPQ